MKLRQRLIPSWAKDPGIGNRLINARLETAAEKPSFRAAYARRRCVLPADGYYEWVSPKQPYYVHPADGSVLALAGLYEIWRDPHVDAQDPLSLRWTCTVLTTAASDDLGRIHDRAPFHDRAPLLVPTEAIDDWLDSAERTPPAGALIPAAPGMLLADRVSTQVNSVRNNGPELVQPPTRGDGWE